MKEINLVGQIVDGKKIIFQDEFVEGFARVQNEEEKWNFIDQNGKLLSKIWYIGAYSFSEGFAVVKNEKNKYNFIDQNGKLLSNIWYNEAHNFSEGFALVDKGGNRWNFIDKNGKFLSKTDFYLACSFVEGFARVMNEKRKWNFIDINGKFLSNTWFNWLYDFYNGVAIVENDNGKRNIINKKGKMSKIWFDYVMNFFDEFSIVKLKDKYYFIDKDGNLYYTKGYWSCNLKFKIENKINNYFVYKNEDDNYFHIVKNYKYVKIFDTALPFEEAFPELVALGIKFNN